MLQLFKILVKWRGGGRVWPKARLYKNELLIKLSRAPFLVLSKVYRGTHSHIAGFWSNSSASPSFHQNFEEFQHHLNTPLNMMRWMSRVVFCTTSLPKHEFFLETLKDNYSVMIQTLCVCLHPRALRC